MTNEGIRPVGAVLLCGGKGERLSSLTTHTETGVRVPKPLVRLGKRELIRHTLDSVPTESVEHVVFAVNHHADMIRSWVTDADLSHKKISFSTQEEPGVLAAIASGAAVLDHEGFVTATTDTVRDGLHLPNALRFHQESGRLATMIAAPSTHLSDELLLSIDESDGRVIRTEEYPEQFRTRPDHVGLAYTGMVILEQKAVAFFDPMYDTGMNGVLDPLVEAGEIGAFVDKAIRYININTPRQFNAATSLALD